MKRSENVQIEAVDERFHRPSHSYFGERSYTIKKVWDFSAIRNKMGLWSRLKYQHPPFFSPSEQRENRGRLAVLYYVPKDSLKYQCWSDGFAEAMHLLSRQWEIHWIHVDDFFPYFLFRKYDALLVKSNWGWRVDRIIQRWRRLLNTPCFLILSGSQTPPDPEVIKAYVHVFYETSYYQRWEEHFRSSSLAFGINTNLYFPGVRKKKWDYLGIGALRGYKRWERLASRPGRKLIIGEDSGEEARALRAELEARGVEVKGFQRPEVLREYILSSKTVYIPACLQGGGERAVLEARACGVPVEVEEDNPKLQGVLSGPLRNQHDYGDAIKRCLP